MSRPPSLFQSASTSTVAHGVILRRRLSADLRPPELYLCAAAGVVSAGGCSALGVFFPHHLVLLQTSLLLLYSCRAENRSSLKCSPPQKHNFSSWLRRKKASPSQGKSFSRLKAAIVKLLRLLLPPRVCVPAREWVPTCLRS